MYGPPRRCKRKMTRTGWSAQKPVARRNLAFRIEPHYVKDCLAKIYAECVNLHGTPPVYIAYISHEGKAADHAISHGGGLPASGCRRPCKSLSSGTRTAPGALARARKRSF